MGIAPARLTLWMTISVCARNSENRLQTKTLKAFAIANYIIRRNNMLIHADDNNFKSVVLDKNETVLVDFFADWCSDAQSYC